MLTYQKHLNMILRAAQDIASREFQEEAWFPEGNSCHLLTRYTKFSWKTVGLRQELFDQPDAILARIEISI
jgi:hypothetical protein